MATHSSTTDIRADPDTVQRPSPPPSQQQQQRRPTAIAPPTTVLRSDFVVVLFILLSGSIISLHAALRGAPLILHVGLAAQAVPAIAALACMIYSPQCWTSNRTVLVLCGRAFAFLPGGRNMSGLPALLQRPASPGMRGAAVDAARLLAGSRILSIAVAGLLLPLPPELQVLVHCLQLLHTHSNYCRMPLLRDPRTRRRLSELGSVVCALLPPLPITRCFAWHQSGACMHTCYGCLHVIFKLSGAMQPNSCFSPFLAVLLVRPRQRCVQP